MRVEGKGHPLINGVRSQRARVNDVGSSDGFPISRAGKTGAGNILHVNHHVAAQCISTVVVPTNAVDVASHADRSGRIDHLIEAVVIGGLGRIHIGS